MSNFSDIRKIDNTRNHVPWITFLSIGLIIIILIWFFKGGSFRLYASAFFGLYYLTGQIWISVLLIGILQNIVFLPLRFIGMKLSTSIKSFENELDSFKNTEEQYLLFQQKVKKGDVWVSFYIFNFLVNAIAFFSAGRIFLINFYTTNLNPDYLYSFIPYPQYPLRGTDFYFPFFRVNQSISVDWHYIIFFWLGVSVLFALVKLLWRFFKIFLAKSKSFLKFRINYNRLLIAVGGVGITLIIISTILLRNIPTSVSYRWLVADLTRQNSTMNLITAIGTFLTVIIAGLKSSSISKQNLLNAGIDPQAISLIIKSQTRQSFKNALILGAGAYLLTNQIPCAFELSVAMFEVLYILSPFTFDKLLISRPKPAIAVTQTPGV